MDTAEQLKPTLVSGGSTRNFKAGPFVIFAPYTTGVAALIDAFYTANALTGANRAQVYRLTADAANVDIGYNFTAFRPKAAVLTDGGNRSLHLVYMTAAAIPAEGYATSQGTDLLTNCFTFASEPHNTNTGTAVNNAISAIKDYERRQFFNHSQNKSFEIEISVTGKKQFLFGRKDSNFSNRHIDPYHVSSNRVEPGFVKSLHNNFCSVWQDFF